MLLFRGPRRLSSRGRVTPTSVPVLHNSASGAKLALPLRSARSDFGRRRCCGRPDRLWTGGRRRGVLHLHGKYADSNRSGEAISDGDGNDDRDVSPLSTWWFNRASACFLCLLIVTGDVDQKPGGPPSAFSSPPPPSILLCSATSPHGRAAPLDLRSIYRCLVL